MGRTDEHPGGGRRRLTAPPSATRAIAATGASPPPPAPARRRLRLRALPPSSSSLLGRCSFPPPGSPLACAVSGGADSMALLLLATGSGCAVTAVHVDHGLRPGTEREAALVAEVADRVGAGFSLVHVEVAPGPNLEARARSARLGALPSGAATGHTMDDQAETVLLNLLRGAGADGLAGMRPGARHPLLGLRRAETAALCAEAGIEPVRDPMNADPAFLRTRVRTELLPLCNAVAGRDLVPVLARQAGLLRAESDLLGELAAAIDPTVAAELAVAPPPLARRALRAWLRDDEGHPPDAAAVERVLAVARGDRVGTELAPGRAVRRSSGRLTIGPARRHR